MISKYKKLELGWSGKDKVQKLEPRVLIEDPDKSFGDMSTGNMLIHADNLLALKALEQKFTGKIKCIYIDPPFNTGSRIDADGKEIGYDDGIEHSIWLNMMYNRLNILFSLLSDQGSIFIHLDDNESDYCKLLLDEIFNRNNFINRITIDARSPSAFSTVNPGVFKASEYILWYAKNKTAWESRSMRIPTQRDTAYNKYIINRQQHESLWEFESLKKVFLQNLNEDRLPLIEQFLKDIFIKGKNLPRPKLKEIIVNIFPLQLLLNIPQISNYLFTKLKLSNFDDFYKAVYIYFLEKCTYNYSETDLDNFVFQNADCVFRETEISDEGAGKETVELTHFAAL
ncbi:MAG: DNA methyltransferase [Bacteroidia bacterium]